MELDMYQLKLSKLAARNSYWATANNAVFKARRLPMEEKIHYLKEINLNVDVAREIKEVLQKSPR